MQRAIRVCVGALIQPRDVRVGHRNRSEHDAYQNLLDTELKDALCQRYEQDFVAFNYSP